MIFVHKGDNEIFGYYNKSYNYFCKEKYTIETSSLEYNWTGRMEDGSINQLAPTSLWRW